MRSSIISRVAIAATFAIGLVAPLAANAQFSGTNGQVFFSYYDANKFFDIAAVNPDGTQSHVVLAGSSTVSLGSDFAVSPDGTKIAYTEYDTTSNKWVLNIASAANGSGATTLYTPTGTGSPDFPAFDSAGTNVYFSMQGDSTFSNNGIYKVPSAGGAATLIEANPSSTAAYSRPVVSVADSKVFFLLRDSSTTPFTLQIDSAALTGGAVTTVYTSSANWMNFDDVSPDGSKILFEEGTGGVNNYQNVFAASATNGTGKVQLTNFSNPNTTAGANYSPDGTKLLYYQQSNSNGTTTYLGAFIVNADGTGTPTIVRSDAQNPFWSLTTISAPGTFASELPVNLTTGSSIGAGGGGGTGTGLPNTGALPHSSQSNTLVYLALGLVLTTAVIEVGRRVRVKR